MFHVGIFGMMLLKVDLMKLIKKEKKLYIIIIVLLFIIKWIIDLIIE